jgi:hypothetical protein
VCCIDVICLRRYSRYYTWRLLKNGRSPSLWIVQGSDQLCHHVSCSFARYDRRLEESRKIRSFSSSYVHLLICWSWMNVLIEALCLYRRSSIKLIRRCQKLVSQDHIFNWYVDLSIFYMSFHTSFVLELVELKIDVLRGLNSSPPAELYLINVDHLASYIFE